MKGKSVNPKPPSNAKEINQPVVDMGDKKEGHDVGFVVPESFASVIDGMTEPVIDQVWRIGGRKFGFDYRVIAEENVGVGVPVTHMVYLERINNNFLRQKYISWPIDILLGKGIRIS